MANEDTTKNGVSDAKDSAADYTKIERDNDVNDIVANAKKARELEASGVDMTNPMEVNLAMEKIEKGEDPNPNAGKKDPGEIEGGDQSNLEAHDNSDDQEMVMVKINGVEKRVLKSEVDAEGGVMAYQKVRSADEKMRQAAAATKQVKEREANVAKRELAFSQQEQANLNKENSTSQSSEDAGPVSAEAKALKDKMYSGDEDQAASAIQTILDVSKGTTQKVDTETLVNQTAAQVQWQNDLSSAKQMFSSEFKDINSNPEYRKYADQATLRIKAENPNWTPTQIIREAGEQSRLKFRDQIRETDAQAETDKRLDNKRATDNVRGNDAKVAKKPAKKALSPSEIVKGLQANRSHAQV